MKITVERLVGWDRVLNDARVTVGKSPLNKEPSEEFKRKMLISEHSPIRRLLYEVTWENIPYWVAMHYRTHSRGFKSDDDDLFFISTQRTDRTQTDRDKLPQDAPVILRVQINAQAIINVSRVRLCHTASVETRKTWESMIEELRQVEPILADLCMPNCVYRGLCPEPHSCGYYKTGEYINKRCTY